MTKKLLCFLFIIILFLFSSHILFSIDHEQGRERVAEGIELFSKGLYDQALVLFRSMIVDPEFFYYHGDAYFWIAKCQMVLGKLDDATKNLEYFLIHFDNHVYYSEAVYQKGRLLFMQNEFEKSIQVLEKFIEQYPTSVFISNAYFWVAESVFFMGRLGDAEQIYRYIVSKFPNSYKFETSKYRISIIEFKKRENELLKLLKWSHMEALKTMDDFKRREKTYEQAIATYQKRLSNAGIEYDVVNEDQSEKVAQLSEELEKKNKDIENLNNAIILLQQQIAYLEAITGITVPDQDIVSTININKEKKETELSNDERLRIIKTEAEEAKKMLQKLLQSLGGDI
ncbi:MAG: tetratricopeptide repeat protein [Spirochaetales bacterium]|nr:tetratricopeptide repeat protein [Spirochaetales bacterium]